MGQEEDEAERLAALASYAILDTAPEAVYDGLARLAAHLCQVPIALVTLVDDHRQWFKARIGLDVVSTDRTDSFCAWTIDHDGVMAVGDALLDERFADNPLVTGAPHIRFYAGAPLRTPDGFTLGALCVIDRQPRAGLTAAQADGLEVLAHQVVTELELRRALVAARETEDLLIAADHLKDDVVAMTSHELQTPITAIIGASDVLQKEWDRLAPSDREGLVQIVGRQGRRLSSLVQDLLTLASAEAGSLRLVHSPVSLAPLIGDIIGGDPALGDVAVRCPPDLCAWADPHRVEQIVVNYLSNAVKYGEPPIEIDVRRAMGWIELRVHDSGPGVPTDQLSSLFGRFAPGTRTVHRSTGLGLSIARHLARALDGDVWYERSEQGGACFAVRLPAANA